MTSKMDRRTFLQGTSAGALLTLLPASAEAAVTLTAPKRAAPAGTAPSGAAGFNKGRSQVNLNFLQIGGDFPFINCLKDAQAWSNIDGSGSPEPTTLDSNGYPLVLKNGGVMTVFFVPSQAERPGNYVITWTGNGEIYCAMNNVPVSGSKVSTNGIGRYVFSTTDTRFAVAIVRIGSPAISNLQVFHVDDEAALNAGQIFGARFKQRLAEANFGVIRFLNWQQGNQTNVTTWATRKPLSYVFYSGPEFRSTLYCGMTKLIGSTYSASMPGFTLKDKATVIIKFDASYKGPCALNVSGTGDINILDATCTPLSSGGNSFPVAGKIATLVYDATLNAWIKQGGDVALGDAGINNSCPPELMLRLCAEVGAHPYFVTPPLAIDPATDYMPSLAAYCRDTGPSWMIPRFEGPNEVWNNSGGFLQTGYANAKASAYGWGKEDFHNWYGKAMSVLGQAVSAAFGADRTRYQVVCGVQTMTGHSIGGTVTSNDRLASTKYLAQAAPPQSPYTKTPASNWVTHVCCAQYYLPTIYGQAEEQSMADAYAGAQGDPTLQQSIASSYASTANSGGGFYTLSQVAIAYANWKAWAKNFGIKKMCGYEGGYSPDYTGGGLSKVDRLRAASKKAPVLSNLTRINYTNFVSLSDASFTAEFPSCFQLSGPSPSSNVWSVLENIYEPSTPQWSAIVSFNH